MIPDVFSLGFAVLLLLGYGLAATLSRLARGETGGAALLAGLFAGLLTLTGPAGVLAGSTALLAYGVIEARRSGGQSLVIASVLMFVPLTVLAAFAVTALIETGLVQSIHAGPDPFLRGRPPDPAALALAAPGLLPLAMMPIRRLRADAAGPLALLSGGLTASLALASAAPLLPLAFGAGLAAAGRRPLLLAVALALGGFTVLGPFAGRVDGVPVIAPWRIDAGTAESLPAWGVSDSFAAAHPGALPRLTRENGRYVLNLDGAERSPAPGDGDRGGL